MSGAGLPRLLIVDDLFGRTHPDRRNEERANLCGQYLLEDVTGDELDKGSSQKIKGPIAQVVFFRGQTPVSSVVGDVVENNLEATLQVIRNGWDQTVPNNRRWSLILLDLSFHTGLVTEKSNRLATGMPEGSESDSIP